MTLHNQIKLGDMDLQLLPERAALCWREKILFISDLHLGKDALWRSSGQYVPEVSKHDLIRLDNILDKITVNTVVIVGDLVHSKVNQDLSYLDDFLNTRDENFILVKGNHDKYAQNYLESSDIELVDVMEIKGVTVIHDRNDIGSDVPTLSGHEHPALKIPDVGKLPAYTLYNDSQLVLPAFGSFNGSMRVKRNDCERCWVVAEGQVVQI